MNPMCDKCSPPVLISLLLLFGWNSAHSKEVEGVQFEIWVDDPEPRFPDPVYAFVSVRNTSGEPSYIARISELHKLHIHCGQAKTNESALIGRTLFFKQPPDFLSASAYRLPHRDPFFLGQITQRTRCRIATSLPIRPAQIDAETAAEGKRIESQSSTEYLVADAEAEFVVSPDRWIFKSLPNELVAVAGQPAAWRTRQQMHDLMWGLGRAMDKDRFDLAFIDHETIENVPLLWVFPERLNSIQEMLICDTASWRLLELRKLLRRYHLETTSLEKMKQVLDAFIELLKCCGPAELFVLEKRISHELSNRRDPIDANEPLEATVAINRFSRDYWVSQLEEHFPGDPLAGLASAPDYGMDGKRIEFDQIDIGKPRGRQVIEREWEKAGKAGPPPCSCQWIEDKWRKFSEN